MLELHINDLEELIVFDVNKQPSQYKNGMFPILVPQNTVIDGVTLKANNRGVAVHPKESNLMSILVVGGDNLDSYQITWVNTKWTAYRIGGANPSTITARLQNKDTSTYGSYSGVYSFKFTPEYVLITGHCSVTCSPSGANSTIHVGLQFTNANIVTSICNGFVSGDSSSYLAYCGSTDDMYIKTNASGSRNVSVKFMCLATLQ